MSEITVVIPNYNGMKYLAECMPDIFTGKHRILSCSEFGDPGSEDTICDPSEQ